LANAIDIVVNAQDRATRELNGINRAFDTMQKKAEKASGIIMGAMALGAGALGAVAVAGIQQNSVLEQSEARWTTLLKSSEKAEKQMAWMKDYAKTTPFDYKTIDQSATSMMGYGLAVEEVNKWLPTLGDVASVMGGGAETVNGVAMAIGQMNALGRVSAEEMGQLAERGVNAWKFLADGMGMTVGEVRKLSEEGKITAEQALPLIYEGLNKTFGGGTQTLMQSTTGQAMLARENFSLLAGTLTSGVFDWFGANVLPMINSGLEWLTQTFQGGLLSGFQNLWNSSTQAKVALILLAGVITGVLIGAFWLIAPAVASAVIAFAPFLAIGMAVALLAFTIIKYWEPIKTWFQNTFGEITTAFTNFFMGIWTLIQPILSQVVAFIGEKLNQMKAFWDENGAMILQAVQNVWGFISGFISTTLNVILAIFNFVFPAIKFIVMSVWETIKGLIDGALKFIMGVIQVFAGLFTGNWSKLWEGIKNMFFGAIQFIWNYVQLFFGAKILGVIGKFAGKAFNYIKQFGSRAGNAIKTFATNVWNAFKNMVSRVISTIKSWVSNIGSAIDNFVYRILSKITSFNTDLGLLFTRGWEALKGIVKKGIQMAVDAVKSMFSTFKNAGKGLLDALTDGIKKGIGKAVDAVKGGMKKIRDFLPFSPAKRGALSDLDKSGKSFFPTFADGMARGVNPMLRMADKGMSQLNGVLAQPVATMEQLDSFNFGRTRQTLKIELEVSGGVDVNGQRTDQSTTRETYNNVNGTVDDVLRDLRQAIRKR
jgi:tape measure domain-containing protein